MRTYCIVFCQQRSIRIVKAMVFPVVTYKCESWIIKNAECPRIEAFKLLCWKRLFGESVGQQGDQTHQTYWKWTLNIHWEVWYWSWSSNTLTTWREGPTHWGKISDAGKGWTQEKKGEVEDEIVGWHHWLSGHEFEQTQDTVKDREAWRAVVHGVQRVGHDLVTEQHWIAQRTLLCSVVT